MRDLAFLPTLEPVLDRAMHPGMLLDPLACNAVPLFLLYLQFWDSTTFCGHLREGIG